MTYPLITYFFNEKRLRPLNPHASETQVRCTYSYWINCEESEDRHGRVRTFYRFHALSPLSAEMAAAYAIECPHCHRPMEQVWDYQNPFDLGLYICPKCDM